MSMTQPASGERPIESPKDASASVIAQHAATLQALPFSDVRDFDDAKRGFLGTVENARIANRAGQGGLEPRTLRLPWRGKSAADGRSEPVAAVAAQHEPRPVRGGAGRLSGARPRHRQHDADRGRQRRDRGRYADLDRRRARRDGALLQASRQAAGGGGHLHPHPHRPLGRRARRARRREHWLAARCRSSRRISSWSMRSPKTSSPAPRCCGGRNISSGRCLPRACAGRSIAGSASRWRRVRWRCCARPT